jgi:hypothetical protein
MTTPQKILVFEQCASGESKIQGIIAHGGEQFHLERFSIDDPLPPIIEDSSDLFPARFKADLVLDYFKHPDLTHDLADICRRKKIPLIASGKKICAERIYTPPT